MKKLEELGVSPVPWKARMDFWIDDADGDFVFTDSCVTNLKKTAHANTCLLAAAPELYEALAAIVSMLDGGYVLTKGDMTTDMITHYARIALAKAAGESEGK